MPDLPTKDEIDARPNEKNQKPQFDNDNSKINIINKNNKTLLNKNINRSAAPPFIPKKHKITNSTNSNEISSNSNDANYNSNQINQNKNFQNQIYQSDNIYQNKMYPNDNIYQNQINPNGNIYQNQIYPNGNINYEYQNPQAMAPYPPHMNIEQPVIIQQSYNQQNIIRKNEGDIAKKACCYLLIFNLFMCLRQFFFYLCCYIITSCLSSH